MGEKEEDCSATEEFILGSLLEAPVTNDRSADDDVRGFYAFLLEHMEEEAICTASLGPWD